MPLRRYYAIAGWRALSYARLITYAERGYVTHCHYMIRYVEDIAIADIDMAPLPPLILLRVAIAMRVVYWRRYVTLQGAR